MRTLNCKRATRMMPLYIGGDLPGHLDREMVKHLAICEECDWLAQEYRESSTLLAEACAPPEFGAQFYDEIRNTVLDQIARDGVSSKPQFGRRWIYAAAFAVMLVASAFMFVRWHVAREAPSGSAPITLTADNSASGQEPNSALSLQSRHLPSKFQRASQRVVMPRSATKQLESARNLDAPVGVSHATSAERAPASEVSRIELQTSNPNIRIIWLVAEYNRAAQETNQDTGEPETRNKDRE
jgi:Putative zinc-finger